jgi:SWI/SNF-related matrix-associated actin-dependent regulator 1 of chromatin subfamily A
MVRLPSYMRFSHHEEAGLCRLHFPNYENLRLALKAFPGARYAPELGRGTWLFPRELKEKAAELARAWDLPVRDLDYEAPETGSELFQEICQILLRKLYPFQSEAASLAARENAWMLNFDMGLGKTATAIAAARLRGCLSGIVVCPAMARLNWLDELDKWWPQHPAAALLETGAKATRWDGTGIGIVSYELASKLPASECDFLFFDEAHYLGDARRHRSVACRDLRYAHRDALTIELTATPITNEIKGLHHQLELLYPGRFGSWGKFVKRYAIVEETRYTKWYVHGLHPDNAAELNARLKTVSSVVTRAEVAHMLPPFVTQALRVPCSKGSDPRELLRTFSHVSLRDRDALIRAAGSQKLSATVEQARLAFLSGARHVAILTHLRTTAREIAESMISEGVPNVLCLTGEDLAHTRAQKLRDFSRSATGLLVATMHSVNVGIDLGICPIAIFAELDYTPGNVVQAAGRFGGFRARGPTTIILLILEGTHEEIIGRRLAAKLDDIDHVLPTGGVKSQLASSLKPEQVSDEQFFRELQEAARVKLEEPEL